MPAIAAAAAGAMALGAATSAVGSYESYEGAKQEATASQAITGLQQQQNQVRQQQMDLTAQRSQMETLRNNQRARSMALNSATSQGAQFGSGLSGGYGQISGQTGTNLLNTSQNEALGTQMFGLDAQISQQKIAQSKAGTQVALGQGISALGGGISGSASSIGNLFKT
jgi:hypothetical protein